jgi:hypothetical protein
MTPVRRQTVKFLICAPNGMTNSGSFGVPADATTECEDEWNPDG